MFLLEAIEMGWRQLRLALNPRSSKSPSPFEFLDAARFPGRLADCSRKPLPRPASWLRRAP